MAQLLLEDYVSKRNKIINNPQFEEFWNRYTRGAFAGIPFENKQQLVDHIAKKFDPTAKSISIIQEPQQNGTMKEIVTGDSKYLDFIFANLFSGNISLADAEEIYDALESYRVLTARNTPQVSKELQSYKVFFEDPAVKDRQGNVMPGLVKALRPFTTTPIYDFENNLHPNLGRTETFMRDNNIEQVYTTSEHKFYMLKDQSQAKIVLGNRGRGPAAAREWALSDKSHRCEGYWCLPGLDRNIAAAYFPCWLAMDKYGFLDYAIVPKRSGYGGEIKNRFNHNDSTITMNNEDYESILEFVTSYNGDHAEMITNAFQTFITSPTSISYYLGGDIPQFVLRSKDYKVVNKVTKSNEFTSNIGVIAKASGLSPKTLVPKQIYESQMLRSAGSVHQQFKNSSNIFKFPLLLPLNVENERDALTGEYSYANYASSFVPGIISAFKQAFPQDTDLLENNGAGCKALYAFIANNLPTIKQINPTLGNRLETQIVNLIEQDRLYFETKTELSTLTFIADLINNLPMENREQVRNSGAYKALKESFEMYLSLGGLLNWTDSRGEALNDLPSQQRLINMAQGASDDTKKKFFAALLQGGIGATQRRTATLKPETLKDLIAYATEMNIPIQNGMGAVFKMLEDILSTANDQRMSAALESVGYLRGFNGIIEEIEKNAKYIKANAPTSAQILSTILPKSIFSKLYPASAKFAVVRRSPAAAKRTQAYDSLKRSSNDEYTRRSDDADAQLEQGGNVLLSAGRTFKVEATKESLQDIIDICERSLPGGDYYRFMGNLTLLINNENFKPKHIFVTFGDYTPQRLREIIASRDARSIQPIFVVVGTIGDKKIAVRSDGQILYASGQPGAFKQAGSYADFEDQQRGAVFEKFTMKKPAKNSFAFLVEKLRK